MTVLTVLAVSAVLVMTAIPLNSPPPLPTLADRRGWWEESLVANPFSEPPRKGDRCPKTQKREVNENWESRMGGFQEGGFQIVERAAFSSRGDLLLQGTSYLKSTLRLLLRRRV